MFSKYKVVVAGTVALVMAVPTSAATLADCATQKAENIAASCKGKTGDMLAQCQQKWDRVEATCRDRVRERALADQRIAEKRAKEAADRAAGRAAREKPPIYNTQ